MADNRFPVATYAEALPYLRAPYPPELVHGIVVYTPENDQAPCKIGYYVTSETVMSLLNLVCGLNWGVRFEKVAERTIIDTPATMSYMQRLGCWLRRRLGLPFTNGETTRHYVQVRAYVTVFGRTFEDLGEATEASEAMAEYKARAQSFKRAVRWVEVGHCLYAADLIVMWRGGDDNQIRIPTAGERPHMRPYHDERSERYIREQYEHWLEHRGKRIYGEPLNHLRAAQDRIEVTQPPPPPPPQPLRLVNSNHQGTAHPQRVPAPGIIVNLEILQYARDAGFGEAVGHKMTRLARSEEQVGELTQPQTQIVQGWIADLASLKIKEEMVLDAIDFAIEHSSNRPAARAMFTRWIQAKAQTAQEAHAASPQPPASAPDTAGAHTQAAGPPSDPATPPDVQAAPNGPLVSATFPSSTPSDPNEESPGTPQNTDQQQLPALEELAHTITRHGYQQSVVHRLVALSQGQGPERQIAWESLPEDTVREIARLLSCAAQLGWDHTQLQQMVMRAHNSTHQNTPAGRYAAFSNHLTCAARDHAAEAARTAA
jgi:hypothetical protein